VPRRFALVRRSDPSGVSGVGLVAYGVQFDDGHVAVRWVSDSPSTSLWNGVTDLMRVHGHEGATVLQWLDADPERAPHRRPGNGQHPSDANGRPPAQSHRRSGRHRAE